LAAWNTDFHHRALELVKMSSEAKEGWEGKDTRVRVVWEVVMMWARKREHKCKSKYTHLQEYYHSLLQ